MSEEYIGQGKATDADTIAAIRLALEGADNDRAALETIRYLVTRAPESDGRSVRSVRLLLQAVKSLRARFVVARS